MPGFDQTGPLNQGPMTGRGLGLCGGGTAFGKGYGRGFCRRFYNKKEESEILQEEADILEKDLNAIQERLSEIKGKK